MSSLASDRAELRRLARGEPAAGSDVTPLIRSGTTLLLIAIWIFAVAAAAATAWLMLSHARSHTRLTAVSLEQYARRNIGLAEFVVDEFEEFLDQRGSLAGIGSDPAAQEKIGSLVKWLPPGSGGLLVMPDGSVVLSSDPMPPAPVNLTDRRWFRAHMDEGIKSYIGPAILGRVSKRFIYTYTATYGPGPDGKPLALVNLGIPSDAITSLLSPDQHGTALALVQVEGAVVAAQPFTHDLLGKPFPLPVIPKAEQETVFGTSFGAFSVITVRRVPDLGLYAMAALPVATILRSLLWGSAIGFPVLLLLSQMLVGLSNQLLKKSGQVEQALADNKVLFQEVHHRVKNNLQVVSSLLRLQTDRLPPELKPLMEETGARVRAIALVHEQIYRTASPSVVQLDLFLAQLVQQLSASMIGGTADITTDLEPVTVALDRAVPVAILATEAITNAIKHGLVDGRGAIAVTLRSADARIVLEVADSGSGPAEDGKAGLGTRILTALSRQIDGAWSIRQDGEGHTVFCLAWPA